MNVRQPAVAGTFYPADAEDLSRDIAALLRDARTPIGPAAPKVLIVPHAGFVYSGPVAAEAYRQLTPVRNSIRRVALFGPAHRVALDGMAVPDADAFATPLGTVRVSGEMLGRVAGLPGLCASDFAHAAEHSLEVQLPFLQMLLDDFEVLPVVVGHCGADRVAAAMDAVWGGPETIVVISSDLSHYLAYDRARSVDANTCRRILNKETTLSGDEACGANAVNGLMRTKHGRQLEVTAIDLRNSGDTAGDRDRVVGYGAFVLH